MNATLSHIHTIYQAAFYASKGCRITSELDTLSTLYGPNKTLRSYLTSVVAEMKTLRPRSLNALYSKWRSTFGEDLSVTLQQSLTLTRNLNNLTRPKPQPTQKLSCLSILNDLPPAPQPAPQPAPIVAVRPVDSGCSTESISALRAELAEKMDAIERHENYSLIQPQILEQLADCKKLSEGVIPAIEFAALSRESEEDDMTDTEWDPLQEASVDSAPTLPYTAIQAPTIISLPPEVCDVTLVVGCSSESTSALRATAKYITEPIYARPYEAEMADVDWESFEDDEDYVEIQKSISSIVDPASVIPASCIVPFEPIVLPPDFDFEPSWRYTTKPTYRWPSSEQAALNSRLLSSIDTRVSSIRSFIDQPVISEGTVTLNSIYIRSNILEAGLRRYFRHTRPTPMTTVELNDYPLILEPLPERPHSPLSIQYTPLSEVPFRNPSDSYIPSPTSPSFRPEISPPAPEPSIEPPAFIYNHCIVIDVPDYNMNVPTVLAPPVLWAAPEVVTEVRKSRVPPKSLPFFMKAAAEPVLEVTLRDDPEFKGRNPRSKLSNRLHWPHMVDDRKGMYIHMLLNYTPLDTGVVCYEFIIWDIYSFLVPEEIDHKYWTGRYTYWKTEMWSVESDCSFQYPGWLELNVTPYQKAMQQLNETVRRVELDMAKEWRQLKEDIIEPSIIRRIDELEDYITRYKQVVADMRRKYKILYKKKHSMKAAAEPVLERKDPENDQDDVSPDPVMVGKDILVLGNIEQYMDVNGLSDADFEEEEGLDLVGGMRPFVPNVHAKRNISRRRLTPEQEARQQNEDRQRVAELQRIRAQDILEGSSIAPVTYYSGDLYSPLYPTGIAGIREQDPQALARRRNRQQALSANLRRGRGVAVRPRYSNTRPATADDQIRPVSPGPPEDDYVPPPWSIAAFLDRGRVPPSRPLPPLPPAPEDELQEEEEEFDPFKDFDQPEPHVPAPPRAPRIQIYDPFQQIVGDIQEDEVEDPMVPDFAGQNDGWTVQIGKGIGRGITLVDDPETGRLIRPPKKKMGRPKKEGPQLPVKPQGRPKKEFRRKVFKVNALGQLEQVEIVERGIGGREFQRRANILERKVEQMIRNKRQKPSAIVQERAVALAIDGLSDHLTQVYKRSIKIRAGQKLSYFGFKFDPLKRIAVGPHFSQDEFATSTLLGPLEMFQRQNIMLQDFVTRSVDRAISMWRIIIIYTNQNGQHITSTTWAGTYERCFNMALAKITELIARYGEENIVIDRYEVRVRVVRGQQVLVGGRKTILDDKLQGLETRWTVINPRSKTNCLWTAIAIASGYKATPDLMYNKKSQNRAGINLKRKVGTRNEKGGTNEDIQKCCNHKRLPIIVHNQTDEIIATFNPTNQPAPVEEITSLHIMLNLGHYHALLPVADATVQENKSQMVDEEPRALEMIQQLDKEFEPRRIVSYDLESYRNPIKMVNEVMQELDQVAYAIGWAIEVANIGEWTELEAQGYEIIPAQLGSSEVNIAYKRVLGDECLNEAINEWLHNKIFDEAVFYAHNGGKFDIRLILGQSNLLYDTRYVIQSDKLIELNGRLINMDIKNSYMEYKADEGKIRYHTISLRDSLPLFGPDSSLAKLTKELDVPHKKLEEKVNVHELQTATTWEENWQKYEMDIYLRNDVIGLLEVLIKFNSEVVEGTSIPISCVNTGASLSKKYYLKHHYHNTNEEGITDPSLSIYTLDREMDQFIRAGYGGGRCEAFRCGEVDKKLYYYDFTSLYPDVGRMKMPIGQPKWLCEPGTEVEQKEMVQGMWNQRIIKRNIFGNTAFWRVNMRSPKALAGYMMDPLVRKPLFGLKEEGMYVFRWYKDWTEVVIYEEEIKFALDHGLDYEFEPLNAILFQHQEVLKSCMEDLFKKKAQAKADGKPGLSKTWKIIINSLYGVWGLKVLDREGIEIARPEHSNWAVDLATEKLMDMEKIGRYVVSRRIKDLQVKDCNVAVAAAVTAEARMKLYKLFVDIQDRKGEIIYCDTDSIITDYCIEEDPEMNMKWIGASRGKELGSLKNEIEECYEKHPDLQAKHYFDRAVIVAPKLYMVTAEHGKIIKKAHKGYREDPAHGDVVTYDRMKILVNKDLPELQRILEQDTDQWLGGNGDIMKNNIGVRIVKRHKIIQGVCADGHPINKGVLTEDGYVQPYIQKTERRKRPKRKAELVEENV